jgi:hypothetical protein
VRDPQGGSLAQATVTVKALESGRSRSATTDAQGNFHFPGLEPGRYELQVTHPGYAAQTQSEWLAEAGQAAARDFVLQPVSGAPSGGTANLISESQLVGLPLNGRSYTQLATLQAGVSDPSATAGARGVGGGSLNVSGARASSNSFLLDGTNIMDTGNRAPRSAAGVQLGSDAVMQVQVFSTAYSAEYGRGSGGVLNSITRSGSNEFHGTLFEYFRNSKLDARHWTDAGPEPAPFKRNQFGFTITGPIRKGQTYFMGSFEALRDRLTESQIDTFIDADARRGVITNADGSVNRIIPESELSAAVKPYLGIMPLPNGERLGGGFAENFGSQYLPTNENFFTVRVDHQITDRDSLFARYSFDDATGDRGGGIYLFGTRVASRQQYVTLVGSHIFSPSLLASGRFGYTRPVDFSESISLLDIPRSLYFVPNAPQFGVLNVPGAVGFGPARTAPEGNTMNSFQFAGDVMAQRADHGLKFGLEVHRYRWDVFSSVEKSGTWSFNGLDSFLRGGPDGTSITVALPGSDNSKAWRQTLVGLYAQDEYRFRPNLQLSLGVRYEFTTLVRDREGRTSYVDDYWRATGMSVGSLLDHNPSLRNISPRLGVAWSPGGDPNTFVNAGFGIFYDQLLGYTMDTQKNAQPFVRLAVRPNFDARNLFPDAVAAVSQDPSSLPLQGQILDYRNLTSPRVMRYELSVQRQLPRNIRLQASYVGARGNHLLRNLEVNLFPFPSTRSDGSLFFPPYVDRINPVNPAFQGGINMMSSDAQSFYNSFLLTADARLSRAVTMRVSYTFSKTVDDASGIGTSASAQQYGLDRKLDRGPSDFDNRQRVSVSYFYTMPVPRGQTGFAAALAQVFGGWRVGGIFSARTSVPTTVRINVRRAGYLFSATRPNLLPGNSNNPTEGTSIGCNDANGQPFIEAGRKIEGPELFYDPCVFALPEAGTIGNLGRGTVYGPSTVNVDVSLQKEFSLGNDRRLQFRSEFFNLANHTNFRTPTASSMVVYTGGGRFNPGLGRFVSLATASRQIQFALRLSF